MSTKHDNQNCGRCRRIGLVRKAHRIMPNGTVRCDEHYRDEAGLPQLTADATAFLAHCNELESAKNATLQTDQPHKSNARNADTKSGERKRVRVARGKGIREKPAPERPGDRSTRELRSPAVG